MATLLNFMYVDCREQSCAFFLHHDSIEATCSSSSLLNPPPPPSSTISPLAMSPLLFLLFLSLFESTNMFESTAVFPSSTSPSPFTLPFLEDMSLVSMFIFYIYHCFTYVLVHARLSFTHQFINCQFEVKQEGNGLIRGRIKGCTFKSTPILCPEKYCFNEKSTLFCHF